MTDNIKLAEQYPVIAAFLRKNAKHWPTTDKNRAITQALDDLDDLEDKGVHEISRFDSVSGQPESLFDEASTAVS